MALIDCEEMEEAPRRSLLSGPRTPGKDSGSFAGSGRAGGVVPFFGEPGLPFALEPNVAELFLPQ